ncbi:MAG: hypothetical protein IPL96_16660 [Holophagaceae bacterium]|nr:hypothetical protein [Holophagaceae bacterium]
MAALDRRAWLRAAAALGIAGVGPLALTGCDRRRETMRVHLDLVPKPAAAGPQLAFHGLRVLLVDHLEALGGLTVLPWPQAGHLQDSRSRACFLRVTATFGEASLALEVDAAYANGMKLEPRTCGPLPPAEALDWFTGNLPFRLRRVQAGRLCPGEAILFRPLLEALVQEDDAEQAASVLDLSRLLVRRFPDCATGHFLLANQLYNQLLLHPLDQESQWRGFQAYRAGLELLPHHPRGTVGLAQLQADAGLHRDAFDLLAGALGEHPFVPRLYASLCYVARTSGLLELARRSFQKVDELALGWMDSPGENTYLYLGDFEAFRKTCQLRGAGRDARVRFYLGYLALLEGNRPGAAAEFRASVAVPGGWYGFEQLSALYLAALEGRPAEAAALLQAIHQKRSALRAPDGEFTFKLAEAAAFLGDRDRATELAELAFTQGFGCTRWFERSPLFAPARGSARWDSLHQHLRERQSLLESRFSPRRFRL